MNLHHSAEHATAQHESSHLGQFPTKLTLERVTAQQEYLERLEALGAAAAREIKTSYGADGIFIAERSTKHALLPKIPHEVLDRWYERRDAGEALKLYNDYRKTVPLINTKEIFNEIEATLSHLEDEYKESLNRAVGEERWKDAHNIVTALEELRPPDSRVPELKLDDKEHVSPEREAPETQAPTTDSTKDTNPRHGILYRAWTGTMKGVERLVGFDKRPELPIWFETISTPPTFTAQDIRHGAVFGSGMEMIEQVSVGIADLLKGLGGGIAASWISVPLELTWSWFWEGPEGVKKNLDGCGHDHSHDHHHEHHHDHGGGNHDHHHSHESEHEPKKKGVRGFFKEFGEKWQARSEELSRSTGALGSGMVRGGKGFLHAVTHPIETTKFIYSLGTSHEARQEHIAPALRSFNEGFARAMGIITPVLGHKLFDGTGIILGHLAFASIGLPTWIGAMVGNVLFSMPYHILSASLKNRFREIATTREMRRKVKEAEDQFQKMNGSFDRLLG